MIVLSNTSAQVLASGQSIVFDRVLLKHNCGITHRPNTGIVHLNETRPYEIQFHGNVTGTAGIMSLTIYDDGAPLPETLMTQRLVDATDYENISAGTIVGVASCPCERVRHAISIVNSGTTPITIAANSVLIIKEV